MLYSKIKKDVKKEGNMGYKKGDVSQDFNEMVAGLEIRTGTIWTQRRMCRDESHCPTRNSMIKKLNDVSHKVQADASFFNQEKKQAIRNSKENKKQRQGINTKQRKCGK